MKMNKFLRTLYIAPLSFLLTGCWTSIFTVAPTVEPVAPPKTVYTTTVTTPAPKTTKVVETVTVTSYNNDWSFYLDLNAVAAAFAESRSVREFEQLLNSSRYMINNLDLNRDGWIDYLRVIETHRGTYHTMLIQACLAPGLFQDVATLIAEHRPAALYVEVVGDRYLYGYNYIVRPVFVKRPPLWEVYGRPGYTVWVSPYHYGSFPSYYTQPKPVYLHHYQAYVTTYMTNHHYCHRCDNPSQPFYNGYTDMTRAYTRNDYQKEHPNDSFEQRVTHTLTKNGSGVTIRNAGQLRTETQSTQARQAASADKSTSSTSSSSSTGSSVRTTGASSSRTTGSGSAASSSASSGKRTDSSSGSSVRTSGSDRSSGSKTAASVPSTTVSTRVSKSGTTRTTIKTTDAQGRTTTVKRESSSKQNTSAAPARSGASSTRTSGTSTRTSGTSTRTSGASGSGTSTRRR